MVHPAIKQTWIVSGVVLNVLCFGLLCTFPYSLLPGLDAPDSPIKVDIHTASWISSSVSISMSLGMFLTSYLMEALGRKKSFIIMIMPGILGWILVYFASNVIMLMIGRLSGGLWSGTMFILGSAVLGEYTTPEYRGVFLGLKTAGVCFGNLFIHIVSNLYHWRTVALMCMVLQIMIVLNVSTWPESPSWLAVQGRFQESENTFFWLRGRNSNSIREFEDFIRVQRNRILTAPREVIFIDKIRMFLKKFKRRDFIKPIAILMMCSILLECCGRHYFPTYAYEIVSRIMGESNKNESSSVLITIGIDIITTASSSFACVLTKYLKRRSLLMFSGISSLALLFSMCLYLCLVSYGIILLRTWIALSLLICFYSLANFGCTSIPITLAGEIMPLEHKATSLAVSGFISGFPLLAILKLTPIMLVNMDIAGTFAVFGICMIGPLIYLYIELPETKDKTLQEIENYFNFGSYSGIFKKVSDDDAEEVQEMLNKPL